MEFEHIFDDQFIRKMFRILFAVLIALGLIGNLLSIMVFVQKSMRITLRFKLLAWLSLVDLFILALCALELWYEFILQQNFKISSVYTCKIVTFFFYFLRQSRNVFAMSITIDRSITMSTLNTKSTSSNDSVTSHFQIRSDTLSRDGKSPSDQVQMKKRSEILSSQYQDIRVSTINDSIYTAKIKAVKDRRVKPSPQKLLNKFANAIILALLLLLLFNSHFIIFLDLNISMVNKNESIYLENFLEEKMNLTRIFPSASHLGDLLCLPMVNTPYWAFLGAWFWLDMLVFYAIPLATMSASFVFICVKVRRANGIYARLLFDKDYTQNSRIYMRKIKRNNEIICRAFVVNLYFCLSVLPYLVYNVFVQSSFFQAYTFFEIMAHTLLYSNSALNFVFYGVSCPRFRQELVLFKNKLKCKVGLRRAD